MNAPKNNPKDNATQSENSSTRFFAQQILDTSLIGVLITRINDGTILYANKAIASLIGIADIDSVIGSPVPNFYWDVEDRKAILTRFRAEGSITSNEVRARQADGSMIWVSISIQPFDFEGEQVLLSEIVDISERKQAEEAVRTNRARFQGMVETLSDWVWEVDQNGNYTYISPRIMDLLGYQPEEMLGKTPFDLMPPEEAQRMVGVFGPLLSTQKPLVALENTNRHKDGHLVVFETSGVPFFSTNGEFKGYRGTDRDITERKKAEEATRQSQTRFQNLVETLGEWVWEVDSKGSYTYISPNIKKLLGYEPEEVVGKTPFDLMPSEEAQRVAGVFGPLLSTQQPLVGLENINRRKDGSLVILETNGVPFFDADGQILGYRGTDRDVTERKQAEAAVVREKNISDATINSLPGIFYMFDPQGKLIRWNKNYETVIGYSTEELASRSALDAIADEDREHTGHGIQQAFTEGYAALEALLLTRQGTKIPYIFSAVRMLIGNDPYVVGTAFDISERKQLESQIREAFERRGYQVQVSTEISQEIASATELSDLFSRVVTLTKERLGYYHTQLLRYDTSQDAVVLINGYGETGAKMLAGGHKMPMGSGLIGTAAASGNIVMRPTLADDPDWQPNPLLPETKGEIALPIKLGEQILGVLDVQSDRAGAITEDDRLLLEGLCGQIAIAMRSAELVETIRQNETRLAEALKIARLANWEYDVEKDIFTFNDQFYSIFHTTVEKVGGYKITSAQYTELFVYPDDAPLVGAEIGKALNATERVYNKSLEHRILYTDGSIGYITVAVTVERDENGKINRFYGANQDITERKQAEEVLASERRLLRVLMSTMLDQVYIKDAEHRFLLASDTVVRSLGAETSDKVVGKTDFDFHPRELAEQYFANEKSLMESGLPLIDHEESIIDHATGTFRWLSSTKAPLRDSQGNVIGLVGLNRDITERKQAEDALRRKEQEMAERLEEINRLYRTMSHEGWKTYRETADLPTGFMFDQTGAKPLEDNILDNENFTSIPMKVLGGETVGNLAVANDLHLPMSAEDLDFLQQVSDQVALALEGARLAAQTQSALAQTEKLSEAGLLFTRATDLQELVKIAVETLGIPTINRAALETFNHNSANEVESMDVIANWWKGTGHQTTVIGTRYTPEILPMIQLFLTPTPVFIEDAFQDERVDGVSLQIVKKLNIHAVAVLPLFLADKQIGVLLLESEEIHEFNQDEIRLFSAMGPQISTVLENRRQYERAQKQAEREGMLNIISQKIQSATTVEAVLQIAARELGHALGAPMTIAQLSMKDKK